MERQSSSEEPYKVTFVHAFYSPHFCIPTYRAGPMGPARLRPVRYQVLVPRTWLSSLALLFCPQSSYPGGRLISPKHSPSDQTFTPCPSPLPTALIQTTPASLRLPGVFQLFLFTCAHQLGFSLVSLTFVSVHLSLPVRWLRFPHLLLFSIDPSLKACPQTASPTELC